MRLRLGVAAGLDMTTPLRPRRRAADAAPERAARPTTAGSTAATSRSARNVRDVASVATMTDPNWQRLTLPRTRRRSLDSELRKPNFAVAAVDGPVAKTRSASDGLGRVLVHPA